MMRISLRRMPLWLACCVWVGAYGAIVGTGLGIAALAMWPEPAWPHSIYTNVHGKDQQLCCGNSDCAPVLARTRPGGAEFFVGGPPWETGKPKEWVFIPEDRITFLPVPGEAEILAALPDPPEGTQYGHFCGRPKFDGEEAPQVGVNIFGNWKLYCAFLSPGST